MIRSQLGVRHRLARGCAGILVCVTALVLNAASTSAAPRPPQNVEPSVGASLTVRMTALFHAISLDSLAEGEQLFFPESAYASMKTSMIPNPASDYSRRLVSFFQLDLATYHASMFSHATTSFLSVNANPADAQWIKPGWCENSIGYWHLPRIRLVYRQNGVVRSVAVASLISWHGAWYVVHLGPNPRPRNVGTLDAPSLGRGVAGPAGGC